jgi:hypothetical protein
MSKWNLSPQNQSALSKILRYIDEKLDVPDMSPAPQKQKQNQRSSGKNKSGKSETTSHSGQLPMGLCHQYYLNGQCDMDPCRFPHVLKKDHDSSRRRNDVKRRPFNGSAPNEERARALAPPPYNSKPRALPSVNHMMQLNYMQQRLVESESAVGRLNGTVEQLTEQLENNTAAMTAVMYGQLSGDILHDCEDNVFVDCDGGPLAENLVQATTRSATLRRPKAPTEMERLRNASKQAKITSDCSLQQGPVIDSATDLDIIGNNDLACAKNIQSCDPVEFLTASGKGVSKLRGDLSTPLVDLTAAPIVKSSSNSIVSTATVHDAGFTIVSSSKGMTLHKGGLVTEAVPSGGMYRLPVTKGDSVDAEVNYAVAQHRNKVMSRVLKKLLLHRKRGHRPADPVGCPDGCGMQLTRKPARKSKPNARRHGDARAYVIGLDSLVL